MRWFPTLFRQSHLHLPTAGILAPHGAHSEKEKLKHGTQLLSHESWRRCHGPRLVPDFGGIHGVKTYGFPRRMICKWWVFHSLRLQEGNDRCPIFNGLADSTCFSFQHVLQPCTQVVVQQFLYLTSSPPISFQLSGTSWWKAKKRFIKR